mmetsp:Transcript_5345/g.16154  ORF Transcript_5345/g.16154 Transcript_5345/m.16154 type:complete len:268 (+) Transcript_5345:1525-2328(+)
MLSNALQRVVGRGSPDGSELLPRARHPCLEVVGPEGRVSEDDGDPPDRGPNQSGDCGGEVSDEAGRENKGENDAVPLQATDVKLPVHDPCSAQWRVGRPGHAPELHRQGGRNFSKHSHELVVRKVCEVVVQAHDGRQEQNQRHEGPRIEVEPVHVRQQHNPKVVGPVVVQVALQPPSPPLSSPRVRQVAKHLHKRPRPRLPVHLPQRVHELIRRHVVPVHPAGTVFLLDQFSLSLARARAKPGRRLGLLFVLAAGEGEGAEEPIVRR